jgi:hypothetical protein
MCLAINENQILFQDSVEATAEVSKTFDEKIGKYCDVTLMSLAYAGTGNVLKVFAIVFEWKGFQQIQILKKFIKMFG